MGTTSCPCASTQASANWAWVTPWAPGDGADHLDRLEVRGQVLGPPARQETPIVEQRQPGGRRGAPAEHPPPQGAVGHDADAELAGRRHHLGLQVPGEQRPLGLDDGDRVGRVRAAQLVGSHLADPQCPDLARPDQLREGAHALLDRHPRVDPMQVLEVEVVGAQPPQRAVDGAADVVRPAVEATRDAEPRPGQDADLAGQHHPVPSAAQGLAQETLAGPVAVHVGGVEQRHAAVQRPVVVLVRIAEILQGRNPGRPLAELRTAADTMISLFRGVVGTLGVASGDPEADLVEVKLALLGYLAAKDLR